MGLLSTSTRPLSRPFPTPCPSPLPIIRMYIPSLHCLHICVVEGSSWMASCMVILPASGIVWLLVLLMAFDIVLLADPRDHAFDTVLLLADPHDHESDTVLSRSSCSCCCCCSVLAALGEKDVMVTQILIEDVSMLLMLIEDC